MWQHTGGISTFFWDVTLSIVVIPPGRLWRSWLGHCATSRKVAGSILDGVVGIIHWHNPSGRTEALGLTQPLTEMSTRYISWGIKAAGAYGSHPYHLHVPIVLKCGSPNLLYLIVVIPHRIFGTTYWTPSSGVKKFLKTRKISGPLKMRPVEWVSNHPRYGPVASLCVHGNGQCLYAT